MTRRPGLTLAPLFILLTLALAACSGESPSSLSPSGSESRHIAGLWWLMFGLGIGVYVVVAFFVIRGATRGRRARAKESRLSGDVFIWVGGIAVPALILLVIAVVTVTTSNAIRKVEHDPLVINVEGIQWYWSVRYPAQRITTANEIHVEVGRPVEIHLTARDVIHSFWVPQLAGKVDAIPGQPNVLRFTPEKSGQFIGLCAEFCGLQHAHMGFVVVAQSPGDFGRWAERNAQPAGEPGSELAAQGERIFMSNACAGCHTIRGTPAEGTRGPDLTHVNDRMTIGARVTENTGSDLLRWIVDPASFKPGVLMPSHLISKAEARAVVAYLETEG